MRCTTRAVFASLTCLQSRPPARLFHLRRRAGPRSLRKLVCAGVALRGRTLRVLKIQRTTRTTPTQPKSRKPNPNPTAPRSLRAQRSRHRQSAVSRPLLCAPFTRKRASLIFRRQPNRGGGCRSKNVLTGTVSQSVGHRAEHMGQQVGQEGLLFHALHLLDRSRLGGGLLDHSHGRSPGGHAGVIRPVAASAAAPLRA